MVARAAEARALVLRQEEQRVEVAAERPAAVRALVRRPSPLVRPQQRRRLLHQRRRLLRH
jgi:hypothetical protein